MDRINWIQETKIVSESVLRLRGNSKRLHREKTYTKERFEFFKNRVVNPWNSLPDHMVTLRDLNRHLKREQNFQQQFTEFDTIRKSKINPNLSA